MIKRLIIVFLVLLFLWVQYMSRKYANNNKLIMIFGKKGSGKSTLLTKMAIKYQKAGRLVFSNFDMYGCYKIDVKKDFGYKAPPPNSVIMIDEVGLIWDSRNYKSFDLENVGRFLRLQRHYKCTVILASQDFSVDKRIRDLCDEMYLCVCLFGFISIAKKIRKTPKLHKASQSEDGSTKSEGFITEDYRYYMPSEWIYTYIPRWIKFFTSFQPDPLKPISRRKYNFENDRYLFNLMHYQFYKVDQIRYVKMLIKKWWKLQRMSASVSWDCFVELST